LRSARRALAFARPQLEQSPQRCGRHHRRTGGVDLAAEPLLSSWAVAWLVEDDPQDLFRGRPAPR